MEFEQIKDLLEKGENWSNGMITYRFISDTLHINGTPVAKYEIKKNDDDQPALFFASHVLPILLISEDILQLLVDKQSLTLAKE